MQPWFLPSNASPSSSFALSSSSRLSPLVHCQFQAHNIWTPRTKQMEHIYSKKRTIFISKKWMRTKYQFLCLKVTATTELNCTLLEGSCETLTVIVERENVYKRLFESKVFHIFYQFLLLYILWLIY
mmetsp:Transcript_32214/g.63777  ORF Transcript_32214/g.63777 Transcript_32214/m.63777 type:complete len:127 (-) Transcript_32214:39-419(-)